MENINVKKIIFSDGEYAIYQNKLYRSTAFQYDRELFDLSDTDKKNCLFRVNKSEIDDNYYEWAFCDYEGVRYKPLSIEGDICTFKSIITKPEEIYIKKLSEMNEVWYCRNYEKAGVKTQVVYINDNVKENKPSDKNFYVEKMYNGDLMISYIEELKSIDKTRKSLKQYYGDRITFYGADINQLMFDYYIEEITIDDEKFCMTMDWGIIVISPENESGNKYIVEITDYFNKQGE